MTQKKWTPERQMTFLEALRDSANISAAARAAGMSRRAAYNVRLQETQFREEWNQALEEALDDLEAELRRRAMEGVEKPVYYAGRPCGTIRNYSDTLGMFLLKCRRPNVFSSDTAAEDAADSERDLADAHSRLGARIERLTSDDNTDASGEHE